MLTSGCKSNTKEIYYPPAPYSPTPPPLGLGASPCHKEGYTAQYIASAPRRSVSVQRLYIIME